MGMFDKIRSFLNGNSTQEAPKRESEIDKSMLTSQIMNLIDNIKRISSFDSSIWNYSNVTKYELSRKTVPELERLRDSLSSRLNQLKRESSRTTESARKLEEAKWTGQKPQHLSNHEFDRLQRGDDR